MKKTLLAALFAFAAVSKSHAVGYIVFDNYDSSPYMPVVWEHPNPDRTVATSDVHVDLLYTLGVAPFASTDLGLSVPIDPTAVDNFGNHGYFKGGAVTIPGYVSGPVTFQVEAWMTTGPKGGATYAQSSWKGVSGPWQESSLATTGLPIQFFAGLSGPSGDVTQPLLVVLNTPEPSIYAFSGIGLSALILNRRRVASKRSEDGKKQV
jgi:hypothetical protein